MQFRRSAYPNAWTAADVRRLRELAEQGISPGEAAKLLRRTESAIRNKAGLHGISFQRRVHFGFNKEQITGPAEFGGSPLESPT